MIAATWRRLASSSSRHRLPRGFNRVPFSQRDLECLIMGAPMAATLIKPGFKAAVWHRTRSKTEPLAVRGARVASRQRRHHQRHGRARGSMGQSSCGIVALRLTTRNGPHSVAKPRGAGQPRAAQGYIIRNGSIHLPLHLSVGEAGLRLWVQSPKGRSMPVAPRSRTAQEGQGAMHRSYSLLREPRGRYEGSHPLDRAAAAPRASYVGT